MKTQIQSYSLLRIHVLDFDSKLNMLQPQSTELATPERTKKHDHWHPHVAMQDSLLPHQAS